MVLDASGRVISTNIGAIPPAQLIDFVNQAVKRASKAKGPTSRPATTQPNTLH